MCMGAEADDLGVVVVRVLFLELDTTGRLAAGLLLVRPDLRGQAGARLAAEEARHALQRRHHHCEPAG
jgi:hypothetical protein